PAPLVHLLRIRERALLLGGLLSGGLFLCLLFLCLLLPFLLGGGFLLGCLLLVLALLVVYERLDVGPPPLDVTRQLDGGLHLARGRLPVGTASLALLEALERLRQPLRGRLIGRGPLLRVDGARGHVRIGSGFDEHTDRLHPVL